MGDIFQQLTDALRQRLAVIADRDLYERDPAAHLAQLQAVSETITNLATELPKPVDPDLAHYLHRASYSKALAWLESKQS
jgi:hypothetical protein